MELNELRLKLIKSRGRSSHHQEISNDDLLRAIKKVKILGNGFTVIPLDSGRHLIQSVPGEFSMDQTALLQKAESNGGFVTFELLRGELGWDHTRCKRALHQLVKDGIAWIDTQDREHSYWLPSIFTSTMQSE